MRELFIQKQTLKFFIPCVLIALCLVLLIGISKQWLFQTPSSLSSQQLSPFSIQTSQPVFWSWYNKDSSNSPPQNKAIKNLSKARINAELMGIVIAKGVAIASIAVERKPEALFHIGDKLLPGVTVEDIDSQRVVIDDHGKLGELKLEKFSQLGLLQTKKSATAMSDQFSISGMFSATPIEQNNVTAGIKIDSISQSLQKSAGLQVNDILVQIDNYSIADLVSDPTLWLEYSTNPSVPVHILRDGKETTLTVNAFSLSAQLLPGIAKGAMP